MSMENHELEREKDKTESLSKGGPMCPCGISYLWHSWVAMAPWGCNICSSEAGNFLSLGENIYR